MTPVRDFCKETPAHTLAVALVNPGREYAIYVADKREKEDPGCGELCSGQLSFSLPAGRYQARLASPNRWAHGRAAELMGGEVALRLEPFVHDVVVHIQAK